MRQGQHRVIVETAEGNICEALIDLGAIVRRENVPVSVAIDDSKAMELTTVLSIVAGACEAEVWRQQREREADERRSREQLESLKADDPWAAEKAAHAAGARIQTRRANSSGQWSPWGEDAGEPEWRTDGYIEYRIEPGEGGVQEA